MLKAGKYDLVHKYFETMRRGGLATKALTYKGSDNLIILHFYFVYEFFSDFIVNQILAVLVRTFWKEGKVDEAVEAVRDMERRGVVGTASLYYELACCLCNEGRWRDAMVEVCCCSSAFCYCPFAHNAFL